MKAEKHVYLNEDGLKYGLGLISIRSSERTYKKDNFFGPFQLIEEGKTNVKIDFHGRYYIFIKSIHINKITSKKRKVG